MKKLMAIWTRKYPYHFNGTRWSYGTTQFEVKILATSEGYAMVRRQSAIPFVVAEKELSKEKPGRRKSCSRVTTAIQQLRALPLHRLAQHGSRHIAPVS